MGLEDDGSGFDPPATNHLGNGLANMRSRIERHGGTFSIQSGKAGTQVRIRLPLQIGAYHLHMTSVPFEATL